MACWGPFICQLSGGRNLFYDEVSVRRSKGRLTDQEAHMCKYRLLSLKYWRERSSYRAVSAKPPAWALGEMCGYPSSLSAFAMEKALLEGHDIERLF